MQNLPVAFRILSAAALALSMAGAAGPALAQGSSAYGKTTPSSPPAPAPVQPEAPAAKPPEAPAPAAEAPPSNPVGAGAAWDAKTEGGTPAAADMTQDADAVAVVRRINDYFNQTNNMQGLFLQTDADNKQKKGKFYFERPGKVRFDYSSPSKEKIISDGKYLAIEDHDLKTSDRYPLESTPFRMLLAKEVDFLRDARIIGVDHSTDLVVLTVEDKSDDAGGQIRLFFSKPDYVLKSWIITDAQGRNTRIELENMELNKTVAAELFKFSDIGLPSFRQ